MKYLDWLTAVNFRKDAKGNYLYFPWGMFGPSFCLHSATHMKELRTTFLRFLSGMGAGVFVGYSFWGVVGTILALLGVATWFSWWNYTVTKDLKIVGEDSSLTQRVNSASKAHRWIVLIIVFAVSVLGTLIGLMGLYNGGKFLSSLLMTLAFGASTYLVAMLLIEKARKK